MGGVLHALFLELSGTRIFYARSNLAVGVRTLHGYGGCATGAGLGV
jgi:hypothetical protein